MCATIAGFSRYAAAVTARTGARPSIECWCCVVASEWRLSVLRISTPGAAQRLPALAQNVRVEARAVGDPAAARAAVAEVDGDAALGLPRHDPDRGLDAPPRKVSSTTSSVVRPSFSAVAGAISAALSQVSFVRGFESSWSQPLLA